MVLGYPWGTYVPKGTYDRSFSQQAALDAELDVYANLSGDTFYAAIAKRMDVIIDEPEEEEEEIDPWTVFLIDQETPNTPPEELK